LDDTRDEMASNVASLSVRNMVDSPAVAAA